MEDHKKVLVIAFRPDPLGDTNEERTIELEKEGAEAPFFYKLNEVTTQYNKMTTTELATAFSDEANIPNELVSVLNEKIDLLRRLGFTLSAPSKDLYGVSSLYWLLELPSSSNLSASSVGRTIVDGFRQAATELGFDTDADNLMSISNYNVLIDHDSSMLNNSIDLKKISGAGQINKNHGHIPMLVMLYIAYQIEMQHGSEGKNVLQLSLSNDEVVVYDGKFNSLDEMINYFDFNKASVREVADKLKLTHRYISIKDSISDAVVEDFYF